MQDRPEQRKRESNGDEATALLTEAVGRGLIETGRQLVNANACQSVEKAADVAASTWRRATRKHEDPPKESPLQDVGFLRHVSAVLQRAAKTLSTEDRSAAGRELIGLAGLARELTPPPLAVEYERFTDAGKELSRSISRVGYRMLVAGLPLPLIQYTATLNGIPPVAQEPLIRFVSCGRSQVQGDLVGVGEAMIRLGSAFIVIRASSNLGWDDQCESGATRGCEVAGWAMRAAGTEADPQDAKDALDLLGFINFPSPEGTGPMADMQGELLKETINQAQSFLDRFDQDLRAMNGVEVFAKIRWEECEERSCFPSRGIKLWTEKTKVVEEIPPKPGSQHQLNQDAWRQDHLTDADRLEDIMDWIANKALDECP